MLFTFYQLETKRFSKANKNGPIRRENSFVESNTQTREYSNKYNSIDSLPDINESRTHCDKRQIAN